MDYPSVDPFIILREKVILSRRIIYVQVDGTDRRRREGNREASYKVMGKVKEVLYLDSTGADLGYHGGWMR